MRQVMVLLVLLGVAGCSVALKVNFINLSGRLLEVCSVRADLSRGCAALKPGESSTLTWREGKFEISLAGTTLRYTALAPEPYKSYLDRKNSRITVAISPGMNVFAVKEGQRPDEAMRQEQPDGYPLKPHT